MEKWKNSYMYTSFNINIYHLSTTLNINRLIPIYLLTMWSYVINK